MSRYIKFDDAVKVMACEMYAEAQSQGYDADGIEDFMPEATAWLNDAPSIDIVRCGECKYKQQCHKAVEHTTHKPTSVTIAYRPIGFCSYGEREGE